MLYRTIRYTGKWFNEGAVGQEGALNDRLKSHWSHFSLRIISNTVFLVWVYSDDLILWLDTMTLILYAAYIFAFFSRNISIFTSTIGIPTQPINYGPWIMDYIVPKAFSRLLGSVWNFRLRNQGEKNRP